MAEKNGFDTFSGVGRVGVLIDNKANSVQLQLQLPTRTELGNIIFLYYATISFFFSLLRLLLYTHFGETPEAGILFPLIFWQYNILNKKNLIYFFLQKKRRFSVFSSSIFYRQRTVKEPASTLFPGVFFSPKFNLSHVYYILILQGLGVAKAAMTESFFL